MTFSGFPFLLGFLPLVLFGVVVFGRLGSGLVKTWLLGASLLFYAAGAASFLPLLILSVAGNLLVLHLMYQASHPGRWAAAGIALNLVLLCGFKFLSSNELSPLGLSFFTFTQIGCLLQFADGATPPPRMRDYGLFTAFFPTLLAGPILNPREMLSQFTRTGDWRLTADNMSVGSCFFLVGLLKKTLLADPLASVVSTGFADPSQLTLFAAWQAAASYSLQLYFDFSGYTDMVIGLGRMVGLRLPDNFDQPYRATSVIAYWQRWHMSLTRFLMTNVHAPLTLAILRRRRMQGRPINAAAQATPAGFLSMIAAPVIVTMGLVSFWHGATLPFLVFGLLHVAFLLANHAWRLLRGPALPEVAAVAATYLCVLSAAVFFRSTTVAQAASMLCAMAGLHGIGSVVLDLPVAVDVAWLVALYGIVWFAPSTRQLLQAGSASRLTWSASPGWAVAMGCAATIGLLAAGGTGQFLYFRF